MEREDNLGGHEGPNATHLQLASAALIAQAAELRRLSQLARRQYEAARQQLREIKARLENIR